LVAPYGKGETADILFTYVFNMQFEGDQECFEHMAFEGASENDGVILLKSDALTKTPRPSPGYPSIYEAPLEGYEHRFEMFLKCIRGKVVESKRMTSGDYMVFRSRATTNGYGQITSAHYGKIYSLDYGISADDHDKAFVGILYYFNPTPNDRNLEFDPGKNLFGDGDRFRGMWP
jgi:hypothetical protein